MYEDNAPVQMSTSHNEKFREVYVGDMTLWFSYSTIVAFAVPRLGRFKTDKKYSQTTAKHLGSLSARVVPDEKFEAALAVVFAEIGAALADSSRKIAATLGEDLDQF